MNSNHWQLETRNDIAWLALDVAGPSANVMSHEVLEQLEQHLIALEAQPLKGVVIHSLKSSGFIAGADVREFQHINDPALAADLARVGQRIFRRIATLPFPSVAAIH